MRRPREFKSFTFPTPLLLKVDRSKLHTFHVSSLQYELLPNLDRVQLFDRLTRPRTPKPCDLGGPRVHQLTQRGEGPQTLQHGPRARRHEAVGPPAGGGQTLISLMLGELHHLTATIELHSVLAEQGDTQDPDLVLLGLGLKNTTVSFHSLAVLKYDCKFP
jgi:hypothetical protein